ncbi:unnamed protein product [Zymoseptoria tritici ST99CH_1E4]|uniref:Uncharacterized protein n=1 Tax=Zymoseptoria tritici ST99CH_1E4 TaxID=1276532 RepID=A0A2H1GF31_ZYMTR|nr:unnamed protein product [Zymoseptoria tritici ST99CH_1E4]
MDQLIDQVADNFAVPAAIYIEQAVENFAVPGVIYVVHLIGAYFWEHLPKVQPHNHAVNGTIRPAESLLPVEATMVTETEICKITKFIELTEFETETQTIDKCGPTVFKELPEVKFVDTQTTSTQRLVDASQKALSTTPMDGEWSVWRVVGMFVLVWLIVVVILLMYKLCCRDADDHDANDDPPAPPPGEEDGGNDDGGNDGGGNGDNDDGPPKDEPPKDEPPQTTSQSSENDDAGSSADNNDAGPPEDDHEARPAEDVDAEAPETNEAMPPDDGNVGPLESDDTRSPENDNHTGGSEGDNAGTVGDEPPQTTDAFTYESSENDDAGSSENDKDAGPSENQDAESLGTDGAVPPDDSNAGHLRGGDTRPPENDDHAGAPEGDNAGTEGDGDVAGALPEDDDHATSPVGDIAGGATGHDTGLPANGADGATLESSSANAQDSQSTDSQSSHSSWISLKPLTQWLPGLPSSTATDSDLDQLAKLRNELKASQEKVAETKAELRASNEKRSETMIGFKEALESKRKAEESKKAAEEKLAKVEEQLSRQNNDTANSTKASPHAAEFTPAERREEHEIARLQAREAKPQARVAELEANQRPTEGDRAASSDGGTRTREHDQCPYSREEIGEVMRDQERLRARLVEHIPYLEQALKDAITRREKAKDKAPGNAGDRGGRPDVERAREDCDRAKVSLQKSRDVSSKLSLWHPGPLGTQSQESDHTDDEAPAGDREDDPCAEVRADLRAAHAKIGRLQTVLLELEVENAALKSQGSTTRQAPVPSYKELLDLNSAKFSEDKDARWFATENATLRETNRSLRAAQNNANPLGPALNVQAAPHLAMQGGVIAESSMRLVRELGRAYERIKELESVNQALSNARSPPPDKDDDPCKEVKKELQAAQGKIKTLRGKETAALKRCNAAEAALNVGAKEALQKLQESYESDANQKMIENKNLAKQIEELKAKLENPSQRSKTQGKSETDNVFGSSEIDQAAQESESAGNSDKDTKKDVEQLTQQNQKLQEEIESQKKLVDEAVLSAEQAWASNSPSRKSKEAGSGNNEDPCKEVKDELQASQKEKAALQEELEDQKKLVDEAVLSAEQAWASNSPSRKSKETGSGNNEDPCKEVKEELQAAQKKIVTLEAEIQRLEKLLTKPDQLVKDGSASKSKEGGLGPEPDGDADPCKEWKDALEESRQDVKRMEKLRNVEERLRKAAQTTAGQFYPPHVWDDLQTEHKLDVNQTMDENRELAKENKKLKHKVEHLSRGGKSNEEDEDEDDLFFDNNGAFQPLRKPSGFGKGALKTIGSTKPEVKVDPCKEVKADLATAKAEVERLTAELETAKAELAAKKSAEAKPETEVKQTQTEEDPCKDEKIKLAAAESEVEELKVQLAEAKASKKAKTLDDNGGRAKWDKTRSRNFLEEKVDRLEKELGELKEKTEKAAKELQEKVDSTTKERDAAREEAEKLKSQLATADSDLTTSQTAKEKVIADLVAAEEARKTAEKELVTLREELKIATAALQESLTAVKDALNAKEIALAKCKVEIVDLNEKVKTANEKVKTANEKAKSANNARLASLTADKEALNAKEAALKTCEAEKVQLKKQLEDDNKPAPTTTPGGGVKSRTTLEIELGQALKRISQLEKDLQSAKKLNNAKAVLEENGTPARNPCQKYIDELAKEKAEVKRLKDKIARLERVIQNLQNRLESTPDWRPDDDDSEDDPEDDKPDQGKAANPKDIAGTPQAGGAAPKPATSSGQKQPGGDKATEAGSTADNPVDLEPDSNREAEKAPSPPSDVPLKQPPSAPVFEPEDRSLRDYAIKGNGFSDDSEDEQSVKDDTRDSDDENETPVAPNYVPEIDDLLKNLGVGGKEATKGPLSPPVATDEQAPIPIAEDEQDTQVSKEKSDEAEAPAQDPSAVPLPTSPNDTGTSNPRGGPSSNDNWSVASDVAELTKKKLQATQVDQRHKNHTGGFREQRPMPEGGDERDRVEKEKQKSDEAARKLREILRKLDEEPPEVGNVSDSDYSSGTGNGEVDTGEFDDDGKKGGDSDGDNDGHDPPPPTRKPMPAASQGRNASVPNSVDPVGSQGQSNIPVDTRRQSLPAFDFSSAPHRTGHYQNGESSTRPTSSPQPSTMTFNIPTAASSFNPFLGALPGPERRGLFPSGQTKASVMDAQSAPRANAISPAPQKPMPPANVLTGPSSTGSLPTGQMALPTGQLAFPPPNVPSAPESMEAVPTSASWFEPNAVSLPTGQMALPTGQLALPPVVVPIAPQPMEAVPTSATWSGPNAVPRLALPPKLAAATQHGSVTSPAPQKPAPSSNAPTGQGRTGSLPTGQAALPPANTPFASTGMPADWAKWYGPNAKGGLALPPKKSAATGPQASVLASTPAITAAPPNAQTAPSRAGSTPTGQVALPPLNSQTGSRSIQAPAPAPSPSLGGLYGSVHAPAAGAAAEQLPDIRRAQSPVAEEERFKPRGRFAKEGGGAQAGAAGKSETGSGSGGSRTGGSANRGRSGSGSGVSGRGSKGGIIGSRKQKRPSKEDPSKEEDS